jgi:hypothetical protein
VHEKDAMLFIYHDFMLLSTGMTSLTFRRYGGQVVMKQGGILHRRLLETI